MKKRLIFFSILFFATIVYSQEYSPQFKMLEQVKTTSVKNQGKTGTCWAFASTSFVETELLRMGFDEIDLSEMFTVRHKLLPMAEKYIRYHGKTNFGDGGLAHDLLNVVSEFGFVPEDVYTGKNIGLKEHNQKEMMNVLQGMLDGTLKEDILTPKWKDAIEAVLNTYLGALPQKFNYKGKEYTPKSFRDFTGFNPDNYVEITSYMDAPFYTKYNLELPDNWSNNEFYNVPINELVEVIDNAIKNGYSVCWDGDSGKDDFYRSEGYAVIPVDEKENSFPQTEKNITQEMRQDAFETFDVTDDHLMQLVGIAEDQNGTKFYYTKNSWGTEGKIYDGYWYMSEPYVRLKTIAIMVHKDSIPQNIKEKLGL
ncbi:MAG: aminopeptidase [Ignavibacteriales bacterium]|nr:aminopeptidase [Ignavibacteriales bacterium]